MFTPAELQKIAGQVDPRHAQHLRNLLSRVGPTRTVLLVGNWGIWNGELMVVLDHLRDVGEFAGILFMDLSATAITDHVLVDANLPPRLRHLDVRLTHVTGRRIAELRSQRPGLTILP